MRCTERSEMPASLAIARPVQCVTPGGASPQLSATTRATVPAGIGGLPGLRVLSRSHPSGPASAKRCCQRQTIGRLTSIPVATRCTGRPSAKARTIFARSTCLRGRLRSEAIASTRLLSDGLNQTHTVCAIHVDSHVASFARRSRTVNQQNASVHSSSYLDWAARRRLWGVFVTVAYWCHRLPTDAQMRRFLPSRQTQD